MVSTATVLSLNWIHSKINSGATFHIIGLAKISKIEFLPLDWIYRSIRIITVISCKLSTCALHSFFTHWDERLAHFWQRSIMNCSTVVGAYLYWCFEEPILMEDVRPYQGRGRHILSSEMCPFYTFCKQGLMRWHCNMIKLHTQYPLEITTSHWE